MAPSRNRPLRIAALVALIVALVVALLLAQWLARPLRRLTLTSRQLAEGHLDARVAVPANSPPEVQELAHAFNDMAERLEESVTIISEDRDRSREFLADVSHELRTPIAALRTFNELLIEGAADEPETRDEFLRGSRQQLQRLDWLAANPDYLERTARRAEPYLHFIVEEAERRGLPLELTLVPAVESGFQPRARSPYQAARLWQFVPSTGRAFGLKQTWWYEGRYDVAASTHAALDYLEALARQFGGD